jgi:formylglycine-generating enzyme required for sulfatase activity
LSNVVRTFAVSSPARVLLLSLLPLALLPLAACDSAALDTTTATSAPTSTRLLLEAPDDTRAPSGSDQKKGAATEAGQRMSIPAGKFVAGSTPGDRGRDPSLEPALLDVELGAFEIDKLPYPNHPAERPLTGIARPAAAAKCQQAGGRLCSELEWERACKGPEGESYAGGVRWDASCASAPEVCASGFGVLAMGAAMREWTASRVAEIPKLQPEAAAVRGTVASAADVDHRCAHRTAVADDANSADLGFRCCYGDANDAQIASPKFVATVRKTEFPPSRLADLFRSNERLKVLADDIKYFRQEAAIETVMRRGRSRGTDAGSTPPNTEMTTSPIIWNPAPGEEILLVTGRAGENDSFIVAFYRLPGDRYRVGSAMTMKSELGPIVFVYNKYVRRKMHWTTCWECYGDGGNITYRDENRIVITQR